MSSPSGPVASPERLVTALILLATAATFVFGLFRFDGPARGYWDTYITAPAMFMNQAPVRFVLKDGSPAFKAELEGALPADLVDITDYGIITKDQRLGPGIAASAPFAHFGLFGLRAFFALCWALCVPLLIALMRRVLSDAESPVRRDLAALAAGVLLTWNPYVLNVDRLNANVFAMPLMFVVLALLFTPRRPFWLLGLAFGLLATIREEAVSFVPAIAFAILFGTGSSAPEAPSFARRFAELVGVGALTVLVMLPIFHFKAFAFGDPFIHPSQYAHYEGFRPVFPHRFIGEFNGLFNWPFHTELVRTPHFGYPTYFLLPLVTLRAIGLVFGAAGLLGLGLLARRSWRSALTLVVWSAPVYALFGPQENWEEVKMTFMLLAWPPVFIVIAAGLEGLSLPTLRRRMPALAGLAVVLFLLVKGLGAIHVPVDPRWKVRFPNSDPDKNPNVQVGLLPEERNDWVYFQSMETEAEIAYERGKLSAALPWPASYNPTDLDHGREWAEMGTELGSRDLTVLEIWGYIYGTRR